LSEINLLLPDINMVDLFGENHSHMKIIRKNFPDITITSRGDEVKLAGPKKDTQRLKDKIELMVKSLRQHGELTKHTIEDILAGSNPFDVKPTTEQQGRVIVYGRDARPIKARTINQRRMVDSSEENDIVFAIGPAGTGKTYTAVALAVKALKNRVVKKIILTRPAVEAGESLGFLPGDLKEKIDPYLRPLYDALDDMLPIDKLNFFMQNRVIEVAPLAFMRGRTLDNAFIILDEAQNATTTQLKMFLTRIGPSAKCIVTGDLTQVDLPMSQKSGLRRAIDILNPLEGIGLVTLNADDVVRHRLVKAIILAYDRSDEEMRSRSEESGYRGRRPHHQSQSSPNLPQEINLSKADEEKLE